MSYIAKRTQLAAFVFLCGVSIVISWHALLVTLQNAFGNEAYTHILLVAPLSIALIYMQWRTLPKSFESSAAAGSLLLAGALLIAGFARWGASGMLADLRLSLSMFALVVWWIASVVFCFGLQAFRLFCDEVKPHNLRLLVNRRASGAMIGLPPHAEDRAIAARQNLCEHGW